MTRTSKRARRMRWAAIVREAVTGPSNFRATQDFPSWMAATGRIGMSRGRYAGADPAGAARRAADDGYRAYGDGRVRPGRAAAKRGGEWPGLEGMDLAKEVSRAQLEAWSGGKWSLGSGATARGLSTSLESTVDAIH